MIKHIYIHIPFCIKKCPYCSFYSITTNEYDLYTRTLLKEIEHYYSIYEICPETIYFGGGTPSLIGIKNIEKIINTLLKRNNKIEEITIELNPKLITINDIKQYNELGISRISLGVQSMIDDELVLLGRLNSVNNLQQLYDDGLNNYINNISFDLMYGLPNQNISNINQSLNMMLKYNPTHFSTYCLSIESDVPLYIKKALIPDDNTIADMYYSIRETLLNNDYDHYELSSFGKKDYYSRHNLSYWTGEHYLGFGATASGYIDSYRYINSKITEYLKGSFIDYKTQLSQDDIMTEYIITGLRLTKGISITEFENKFNFSIYNKYQKIIDKYRGLGILYYEDTLRLNPSYYFVSNEIISEFLS